MQKADVDGVGVQKADVDGVGVQKAMVSWCVYVRTSDVLKQGSSSLLVITWLEEPCSSPTFFMHQSA